MIIAQAFEHQALQPILDGLRVRLGNDAFRLEILPQKDAEWNLLEMGCDFGVLSPIGYTQHPQDIKLFKGACIAAYGATNDTNLLFKPGLRELKTVTYIDVPRSEQILAEIVLREKYKMNPRFHPFQGTVEDALRSADAVLVTGSISVDASSPVLDITDEWFDLTQLPFVKFLIAGWNIRMTERLDIAVAQSGADADAASIAALENRLEGSLSDTPEHLIPGHFRYLFDEQALEGLETYYRFAYYHGLNKDIPDISVWEPESEADGNPA